MVVSKGGSSVGLRAGVTPWGSAQVRRGSGGRQHTLGAPGWMEVMQAGSMRGLGRRADSSIRLCHWRGSPVNFCSCWSKPVCTRCSKLDGAEISTRFFFFPNMAPGSLRGEGVDWGSGRQACGSGRLARTCCFSSIPPWSPHSPTLSTAVPHLQPEGPCEHSSQAPGSEPTGGPTPLRQKGEHSPWRTSLLSALLAHTGFRTLGPLPWRLPLWGLTPDSRPLQAPVTGDSSPARAPGPPSFHPSSRHV